MHLSGAEDAGVIQSLTRETFARRLAETPRVSTGHNVQPLPDESMELDAFPDTRFLPSGPGTMTSSVFDLLQAPYAPPVRSGRAVSHAGAWADTSGRRHEEEEEEEDEEEDGDENGEAKLLHPSQGSKTFPPLRRTVAVVDAMEEDDDEGEEDEDEDEEEEEEMEHGYVDCASPSRQVEDAASLQLSREDAQYDVHTASDLYLPSALTYSLAMAGAHMQSVPRTAVEPYETFCQAAWCLALEHVRAQLMQGQSDELLELEGRVVPVSARMDATCVRRTFRDMVESGAMVSVPLSTEAQAPPPLALPAHAIPDFAAQMRPLRGTRDMLEQEIAPREWDAEGARDMTDAAVSAVCATMQEGRVLTLEQAALYEKTVLLMARPWMPYMQALVWLLRDADVILSGDTAHEQLHYFLCHQSQNNRTDQALFAPTLMLMQAKRIHDAYETHCADVRRRAPSSSSSSSSAAR